MRILAEVTSELVRLKEMRRILTVTIQGVGLRKVLKGKIERLLEKV